MSSWSALYFQGRIVCFGYKHGELQTCDLGYPNVTNPTADLRAAIEAEKARAAEKRCVEADEFRVRKERLGQEDHNS